MANTGSGELLPPIKEVAALSRKIAIAVARVAQAQGLALEIPDEVLEQRIDAIFWTPAYRPYKRVSV